MLNLSQEVRVTKARKLQSFNSLDKVTLLSFEQSVHTKFESKI